jgi:SAM-dependent methyltransferase
MRMNSALGKKILATVRDADFAHAGEVEAIERALAPIVKDVERTLLDAGCGRGGTAAYVQAHGWGRTAGFDIDAASIEEALGRYPELDLRVADAATADAAFTTHFDLLYSFNAFYAFPDQAAALGALRRLARAGSGLVLFDYVDRGGFARSSFGGRPDTDHWQPLRLESLSAQLAAAGWRLDDVVLLHGDYERWYAAFVARIEAKHDEIVALAGAAAFAPVHDLYRAMYEAVRDGVLGGAIAYASAV